MISRPTAEPMLRTAEPAAASTSPGRRPPRGPVLPSIMSLTMPIMPPSAAPAPAPAPAAGAAPPGDAAAASAPAMARPRSIS